MIATCRQVKYSTVHACGATPACIKLHLPSLPACFGCMPSHQTCGQPSQSHDSLAACMCTTRRLFCCLSSHSHERIIVTQARFHSLQVSSARIPSLPSIYSIVLYHLLEEASIHPLSLSFTCRPQHQQCEIFWHCQLPC